jgi:hypothetical protein
MDVSVAWIAEFLYLIHPFDRPTVTGMQAVCVNLMGFLEDRFPVAAVKYIVKGPLVGLTFQT